MPVCLAFHVPLICPNEVMEHFISRVLMEASGAGLEESGIECRVRGAGTEGSSISPSLLPSFEVQPNLLAHLFI